VASVDADTADTLLKAAGGSAKVAIVMHLRSVDAAAARDMLEHAGGQLRKVIGTRP